MPEQLDDLAALDARARRAAAALRDQIARTTDPARPVLGEADPGAASAEAPLVYPIDRTPGGEGHGRRRWLLAAAVLVVLAVGVAVFATTRPDDDGSAPVLGTGDRPYLIPDVIVDGLELQRVDTGGGKGPWGAYRVYGDAAGGDPWAGPLLQLSQRALGPEEIRDREPVPPGVLDEAAEVIQVHGAAVPAYSTGSSTKSTGLGFTFVLGDIEVQVLARGVPVATLEAAADAVDLDEEGRVVLPAGAADGFDLLADRPWWVFASMWGAGPEGLTLAYGKGGDSQVELDITQAPGPEVDVDLLRLAAEEARVTEVRGGLRAVVVRFPDDPRRVALRWREPSGLVVTVTGVGRPEQELFDVAEGLRPAEPGEVDRLIDEHAPDPLGGLPGGEEAIAYGKIGDSPRVDYRLSAGIDGEQYSVTVTTLLWRSTVSGSLTGGPIETARLVAEVGPDGGTAAFGLMGSEVARAVLEGGDGSSYQVALHPMAGSSAQAFVELVPAGWAGDLRAFDAAGQELAMRPLLVGGSPDPGTVVSECTTPAAGIEECSSGSAGSATTVPGG